jgi:Uma2 family endonuclease
MQAMVATQTEEHKSTPNATPVPQKNGVIPPLNSGDRLTRAEFERRYEAHPEIRKAELIEGVVYLASPVYLPHGEPHSWAIGWLVIYCAATPGLRMADNNSLQLDPDNEVQPDVCVWIDARFGGIVSATPRSKLTGAPELIVEAAASSAAYDLHDKLHIYRCNGVREYLVLSAYEQETRWYVLQDEEYHLLTPDEQGVIRSRIFPGLWLDPARFWAGDLAGLLDVLQAGLSTPEHAVFIQSLKAASA